MKAWIWAMGATAVLAAQGLPYIQEHYDKREVLVPMRDGVRLFTSIYTPKDRGRAYPFLLERTPYGVGPYGPAQFRDELGPSARFGQEGFIFVYQDVRGRMMSEGTFLDMTPLPAPGPGVDESTDAFDTVAWLLRNVPNNNGRAGQWGVSYPGFYAAAGLVDAHPAVKAVSPQGPILDWFVGDDFHRNGALWLPHLFHFIAQFRPAPARPHRPRSRRPSRHGTRDGYAFFLDLGPLANADRRYFKGGIPFWEDVLAHGTYDAFWQARNLRPHLRGVRPAVLTVGGWYDAENLFGTLQTFRTLARQSPATDQRLVMGPWDHGGWRRPAARPGGADGVLPGPDRIPLLHAPPQGRPGPGPAQGLHVRDRRRPLAAHGRVAAQEPAAGEASISRPGAGWAAHRRPAASTPTPATRPGRCPTSTASPSAWPGTT